MLDIDFGMLINYIRGYEDMQLDMQILAVQTGYWSAYYSGSNKNKMSVATVTQSIEKQRSVKTLVKKSVNTEAEFALFKEREAKRIGGSSIGQQE